MRSSVWLTRSGSPNIVAARPRRRALPMTVIVPVISPRSIWFLIFCSSRSVTGSFIMRSMWLSMTFMISAGLANGRATAAMPATPSCSSVKLSGTN